MPFPNFFIAEDNFLLKLIKKANADILDVGCGEGRYILPLSKFHTVVGVDANKKIVAELKLKGLTAVHLNNVSEITTKFDYIIMSHIIEHLLPMEMLETVDAYVDRLKDDGELIIATPLLYNEFYNDFDHVKPYTPMSIALLFSEAFPQQQRKPRNRLELRRVWIRKWPYVYYSLPGESAFSKGFKFLTNGVMRVLFYASFKLISRSSGWIGVFSKVTPYVSSNHK